MELEIKATDTKPFTLTSTTEPQALRVVVVATTDFLYNLILKLPRMEKASKKICAIDCCNVMQLLNLHRGVKPELQTGRAEKSLMNFQVLQPSCVNKHCH